MSTLIDILKIFMFTPGIDGHQGIPGLFWGLPGIGKTTMVKRIAEHWDFYVKLLVGSIHDPTDFSGPLIVQDGFSTHAPPDWCRDTMDAQGKPRRFLLLLDELTCDDQRQQAAMLGLCFDRRVGGFELHNGVRVLAAANPPEAAAGGYPLTPPLANRFCHVDMGVDRKDFTKYLRAGKSVNLRTLEPVRAIEARVAKTWAASRDKAAAVVGTFIDRQESDEMLLNMPKPHTPEASRAWVSPRTTEMATHVLAGGWMFDVQKTPEGTDMLWELVAGCVGAGVAEELENFVDVADIPDPFDILAGRVKWRPDPQRPDLTHVVANSCTNATIRFFDEQVEKNRKAALSIVDHLARLLVGGGFEHDIIFGCGQELDEAGTLRHKAVTGAKLKSLDGLFDAMGDMFDVIDGAA